MFKIKEIQIYNIGLPLQQTIRMSKVTIERSNSILVKVMSYDNDFGWGEAASSLSMTGESGVGMVQALNYIKEMLIGIEVISFDHISNLVQTSIYGNYAAKSAIEVALIDLLGKVCKKSFSEIIGKKQREELPIIWRIAGSKNEIDEAKEKKDEGFTAFKVKVGAQTIDEDLKRAENIREVLGDDIQLTADANAGYNDKDAIEFCSNADQTGLDYFEQPVNGYDIPTMQKCNRLMRMPLSADEGIHSLADLSEHKRMEAADGASLKLIKFGGVKTILSAIDFMEENNMHVNVSGKAGDSSISAATIGHISHVANKLDWYSNVSIQYLADDIIIKPISINDGKIIIPSGAGLGIDIDEDKIEKYKI